MKNLKQKIFILFISISFSMQAQSAMIGFSADFTSIKIGETLEISIIAEDITELAGGKIDFRIVSSSLSINEVMVDSHWDFQPSKGELDGDVWKGIGFDVFSNAPLNGSGEIAKISLIGEQTGASTLTLLFNSEFFSTTDQLVTSELLNNPNSELTVQVVPLQTSIWFMGSALIGLVRLKRKPS